MANGSLKIAFIVLAHDNVERLCRVLEMLLYKDDYVILHLDKKVQKKLLVDIAKSFNINHPRFAYAKSVSCKWGDFSLVQATLNSLEAIQENKFQPDYVYMISGADIPVNSLDALRSHLELYKDKEFIESEKNLEKWVTGGLAEERFRFYYYFNYQKNRHLFNISVALQRALAISRIFPSDYSPHFGSQWWCLTWGTCRKILGISKEKNLTTFFKKTWIPDEMYFQSIVRKIVKPENIANHTLTYYKFDRSGKPIILHNDHCKILGDQKRFFARKLSKHADELFDCMEKRWKYGEFAETEASRLRPETYRSYEWFKYNYRDGVPGAMVLGAMKDKIMQELEANYLPYFVVIGAVEKSLSIFAEIVSVDERVRCYRRLFKKGSIDYGNELRGRFYYSNEDVALRDYMPTQFLVELLRNSLNRTNGFCLLTEDWKMKRLEGFIKDPNSKVIFLNDDRKELVEEYINRFGEEGSRRPVSTGSVINQYKKDSKVFYQIHEILNWYHKDCMMVDTLEMQKQNHSILLKRVQRYLGLGADSKKTVTVGKDVEESLDKKEKVMQELERVGFLNTL